MKKIILFFPIVFGIFLLSDCTRSAIEENEDEEDTPAGTYSTIETVAIAPQTGCRWIYSVPDGKSSGITVIRSQEELASHLSCGEGLPAVDFNTHSLLLAYGDTLSNVHTLSHQLLQISENEYRLDVTIELGSEAWPEGWTISVLIPKIPQNTTVQLNEVRNQGNPGEYVSPYMDDIAGKWKLSFYTGTDTTDLSAENIIYEFRKDGKLIVTGSVPDDLAAGEHTYEYRKINICPTCLPAPNLWIDDDNRLFCEAFLQNEVMIISGETTEQGKTVYRQKYFVKQGSDENLTTDNDPDDTGEVTDCENCEDEEEEIGEWSDEQLLEIAYDPTYFYPEGFYKDPASPTDNVYYVNTVSISPINQRSKWIELSTNDKNEALTWVQLTMDNSSVSLSLIDESETEKYFEFKCTESVYSYITLFRVHKTSYYRSVFDGFAPWNHVNETNYGYYNAELKASKVKECFEYLWVQTTTFANLGQKTLRSEIEETKDYFEIHSYSLQLSVGDWDMKDVIRLYDNYARLYKDSRLLTYKQSCQKEILGQQR